MRNVLVDTLTTPSKTRHQNIDVNGNVILYWVTGLAGSPQGLTPSRHYHGTAFLCLWEESAHLHDS